MDRSQVQEFGTRSSIYNSKMVGVMGSNVFNSRTSLQRDFNLRKSHLTNIPDVKHTNLSTKLDMVVVFQSIEIQRLSQQLQTSRMKAKQHQKQLLNSSHYEVQIKQLTQRCFRLESERNSYKEELIENKQVSEMIFNQLESVKERMGNVDFTTAEKYKLQKIRNVELLMQVEKWKSRYHQLDDSKTKQLQTIKKHQQQSKSLISKQARQLIEKLESQKDNMQQLIKTIKQNNVEKQTQLKKVKFQLLNKDWFVQQMEKQVDEYEEKVALLSQENYRLLELSRNKQNQLNKLKEKVKYNDEILVKINQEIFTKTEENKLLNQKLQKIHESIREKDSKMNTLQKTSFSDKQRLAELDRIVFLLREREIEIEEKNQIIYEKEKRIYQLQDDVKLLQDGQSETKKEIDMLKQQSFFAAEVINKLLQRIEKLQKLLQTIKNSTQKSFHRASTYLTNLEVQVNQKTFQMIDYSSKLITQSNQSQQYILDLQSINNANSKKILILENERLQALKMFQQFRELQELYRTLKRKDEKLQHNFQRLIQQRAQLIEQNQLRQQQLINQTQIQLKTIEQNYENNIIRNLQQELFNKEGELNHMRQTSIQLERKFMQFEWKSKNIEEGSLKFIQTTKNQWNSKLQEMSLQLSEKIQALANEKFMSQQLRHSLEAFKNFYQSNIQIQIGAIISRIEPMEKMIKYLKSFVFQRLIKEQQNFIDKQRENETKINELIEGNLGLIQQNERIFEMVLFEKLVDSKIDIEKNLSRTYAEAYDYTPNSTYTNETTTKTNVFGCSTNENFNSLNMGGMGSKIKQTIQKTFKNEIQTSIPIQFLIKHVILCAELQSLRQRLADRNVKVEKMKHSLVCSNVSNNKSFNAIANGSGQDLNNRFSENQQQSMTDSNIMSSTIINKLSNPLMNSVVESINNENSVFHQNGLIERTGRVFRLQPELNIRRVTSQEKLISKSPISYSLLNESQIKNQGIYTNRLEGGSGLERNGFKLIGVKRSAIFY